MIAGNIIGRNYVSVLHEILSDINYTDVADYVAKHYGEGDLVVTSGGFHFHVGAGTTTIKAMITALSAFMAAKFGGQVDVIAFGSWSHQAFAAGTSATVELVVGARPLYPTCGFTSGVNSSGAVQGTSVGTQVTTSAATSLNFVGLLIGSKVI